MISGASIKNGDLWSLSTVCDSIVSGAPLIKIPHKSPLVISYEGTSFLLELADLKLYRNNKLKKCEWQTKGKLFEFINCFKCDQPCARLKGSEGQSSVFCESCIKSFK